jgi:hypothetical protein
MIPRKATAVMFLCFSIVVAFTNYLKGEYQYIVFTIPFIASVLSFGKISRYAEIIGVIATAIYIMACQIFHVGLFGMLLSSILFSTLGVKLRTVRIYMFATIPIVAICSYFQYIQSENMVMRALLDSGLYLICSTIIYIALQEYISYNVGKALGIAQEAIDIAKKGLKDGDK